MTVSGERVGRHSQRLKTVPHRLEDAPVDRLAKLYHSTQKEPKQ